MGDILDRLSAADEGVGDIRYVIHPIHRYKSSDWSTSDWSKQCHMTWISFGNVHVWKLIHVC